MPTEPELARRLGVGRTSVREGIGKLRMLGLVEVRRGLGTYVCDAPQADPRMAFLQWTTENHDQILELFEVRMALEATAASLSCARATARELGVLESAARAHDQAHLETDLPALVGTDQAFHAALVRCSHNEALTKVYDILVPQLADYRRKSLALHGAAERSSKDHLSIVEAVRLRDPEGARAAVLEHLAMLYREVKGTRARTRAPRELDVPRI